MFRRFSTAFVAALAVAGLIPTAAGAGEMQERKNLEITVQSLVKAHDLNGLDALAAQLRSETAPGPSGVLRISHFWQDLLSAANRYVPQAACGVSGRTMATDWLKAGDDSVTAHLFRDASDEEASWCARGTGMADTVSEASWREFRLLLGRTQRDLEADQSLSTVDGEWYVLMQSVALGQSWPADRYLTLVRQGMRDHPHLYRIIDNGMIFFSPKWGGSLDAVEEYAQNMQSAYRPELGDGVYARLYWWYADVYTESDLRHNTKVDWPHLQASMLSLAKANPDSWNLAAFARLSCGSADYLVMRDWMRTFASENRVEHWFAVVTEIHCPWLSDMPMDHSIGDKPAAPLL